MFLPVNRWALVCLICCSCSATAGPAWEIGAKLGYATNRKGIDTLNRFFRDNSMAAVADSDDRSRQAGSLYLNIPLFGSLGAQLGYTDLGSADTIVLGVDSVVNPYLDNLERFPIDTIRGSFLAAHYDARLNDMTSVSIRAGLYYWKARYAIRNFETRRVAYGRGIDLMGGIDLRFKLTHRFSATVGWEIYTPDNNTLDFLNLGLIYRLR